MPIVNGRIKRYDFIRRWKALSAPFANNGAWPWKETS
jgi:hypothetical protein